MIKTIMYNFLLCMNKKKKYLSDLNKIIFDYTIFNFVYPVTLRSIHAKCNFCKKNTPPYSGGINFNLISMDFGYLHCENCIKICDYNKKFYCKLNKLISWKSVLNDYRLIFNIPRSKKDKEGNKIIEKWNINKEEFINWSKKKKNGIYHLNMMILVLTKIFLWMILKNIIIIKKV